LTASSVAQVAEAAGIPVIKTKQVDDVAMAAIESFGADLGVIVAYGALLNADALKTTRLGWVNIHYSLLPIWRGAAPVQNALLRGDTTTGVSVFQLDEGMDTGPIWAQVEAEIQPDETAGDLLKRLTSLGISALLQVIPEIQSELKTPRPQNLGNQPLAKKPTRESARLSFANTAVQIERQVRALNPEPMAFATTVDGGPNDSLRILTARALGATDWAALTDSLEHTPGLVTVKRDRVLVHCGKGTLLELKEVQPAGKKPMAANDWARGLQNEVILN
jgi:methionyl-tRNA formyltransferase